MLETKDFYYISTYVVISLMPQSRWMTSSILKMQQATGQRDTESSKLLLPCLSVKFKDLAAFLVSANSAVAKMPSADRGD